MKPRRDLPGAVALVLAMLVCAGAALAALPYQGTRSPAYPNGVVVYDHPPVYLHVLKPDLQRAVARAEKAKQQCWKDTFEGARMEISVMKEFADKGYRNTLQEAERAEARLPLEEKTYQGLAQQVRDRPTPDPHPEYALLERFKEAGEALERDRRIVREAPAEAEYFLQDANTLATILVWLDKLPYACPATPTQAPAPQPAPPPTPAIGQGGVPRTCSRAQAVLDEVNAARTDPAGYAAHWRGGDRESLDFLRHQAPVPALQARPELHTAAGRQAAYLSALSTPLGHVGADGSKPMRRINEAGLYSTLVAELISVGQASPAGAVQQMITDAGQPNRPHRADLFNPNFTLGGVGCGDRPASGLLIVITLSNAPIAR